eukprot:5977376-Amphidinium_carterae.1
MHCNAKASLRRHAGQQLPLFNSLTCCVTLAVLSLQLMRAHPTQFSWLEIWHANAAKHHPVNNASGTLSVTMKLGSFISGTPTVTFLTQCLRVAPTMYLLIHKHPFNAPPPGRLINK